MCSQKTSGILKEGPTEMRSSWKRYQAVWQDRKFHGRKTCDRTMEPDEFQQGEWVHRTGAEIIGPSNADTTYRTEAAGNVDVATTLHCFVVCGDINMKMQHMDVVEDCESKVHKPIRCEVRLHCIEKKHSLHQVAAASTMQIKCEQIKEIKLEQVRPKKKEEMTTSVRKNGKLGRHEVAHVIKNTRIGQHQNGKEDCRRVNDETSHGWTVGQNEKHQRNTQNKNSEDAVSWKKLTIREKSRACMKLVSRSWQKVPKEKEQNCTTTSKPTLCGGGMQLIEDEA